MCFPAARAFRCDAERAAFAQMMQRLAQRLMIRFELTDPDASHRFEKNVQERIAFVFFGREDAHLARDRRQAERRIDLAQMIGREQERARRRDVLDPEYGHPEKDPHQQVYNPPHEKIKPPVLFFEIGLLCLVGHEFPFNNSSIGRCVQAAGGTERAWRMNP